MACGREYLSSGVREMPVRTHSAYALLGSSRHHRSPVEELTEPCQSFCITQDMTPTSTDRNVNTVSSKSRDRYMEPDGRTPGAGALSDPRDGGRRREPPTLRDGRATETTVSTIDEIQGLNSTKVNTQRRSSK